MKRVILTAVFLLAVMAIAAPVRFAIIGDRTGDHQDSVYEKIVAEVAKQKPQFVFTVGDQIEGYTEDTTVLNQEWQEYKAIVAPLKMPHLCICSAGTIYGSWLTASMAGPFHLAMGMVFLSRSFTRW